jgi:hypothetical protein
MPGRIRSLLLFHTHLLEVWFPWAQGRSFPGMQECSRDRPETSQKYLLKLFFLSATLAAMQAVSLGTPHLGFPSQVEIHPPGNQTKENSL